jgi:hypothetical protein
LTERGHQEREIALRHSVVAAEHALASEAVQVGRAFRQLGLEFDPLTFVALRVMEQGCANGCDPVKALSWFVDDGAIERSVAIAVDQLEDDLAPS